MDRSLRAHQIPGVLEPASNNPMNHYSTAYATQFNHYFEPKPTPGPSEGKCPLSGASKNAVTSQGAEEVPNDGNPITCRGFGVPVYTSYNMEFRRPHGRESGGATASRTAQIPVMDKRDERGVMVEASGYVRNDAANFPKNTAQHSTCYNDDFKRRPNMFAEARAQGDVWVNTGKNLAGSYQRNFHFAPVVSENPEDIVDRYSTTNHLVNKATLRGRDYAGDDKNVGNQEHTGFTRGVLCEAGKKPLPVRPQTTSKLEHDLKGMRRESVEHTHALVGAPAYVSTFSLSYSKEARLAALIGQKRARTAASFQRVTAKTNYGFDDGLTGMYVPQTTRDNAWVDKQPAVERAAVFNPQGTGYTRNLLPWVSKGENTAMLEGASVGSEKSRLVMTSQVYGSNSNPRIMLKREEVYLRGNKGAYHKVVKYRENPYPEVVQHPSVDNFHRSVDEVKIYKNHGYGVSTQKQRARLQAAGTVYAGTQQQQAAEQLF